MTDYCSVAGKDKLDKPSLTIVPYRPLLQVSKVFQYGAQKYGLNNWRKGHLQLDLIDSCLRHIYSFSGGSDTDGESGHSHLAHAAANLFIMMAQISEGTSVDNRFIRDDDAADADAEREEREEVSENFVEVELEKVPYEEEEEEEYVGGGCEEGVTCVGESELTKVEQYNNDIISQRVPHWPITPQY